MRLVIDDLRDPEEFQVTETDSEMLVSHFSYFDRYTGDITSITLLFGKDDYRNCLVELRDSGQCCIRGKYGHMDLKRNKDSTLNVSLASTSSRIDLGSHRFHFED